MFRGLVFGALLLAGCNAKTNMPSKEIKVFKNIPSTNNFFVKPSECKWKFIKLSIFNQKDQSISFNYQECPSSSEAKFYVKDGREIFVSAAVVHQGVAIMSEEIHLLSVWKIGSLSDEMFINSLIPKTSKTETSCQVMKENNIWKIGITDSAGAEHTYESWVIYHPLPSGPNYSDANQICGPYSYAFGNQFNIGISDGIAIAYNVEVFDLFNSIDLASITYENKG